jgi:hypothetical protein
MAQSSTSLKKENDENTLPRIGSNSTKFPERGKVIDACKKKGAARSLYDGDSRQNFQSDHAVFERCQWKRFIQLHRPFYHEKK